MLGIACSQESTQHLPLDLLVLQPKEVTQNYDVLDSVTLFLILLLLLFNWKQDNYPSDIPVKNCCWYLDRMFFHPFSGLHSCDWVAGEGSEIYIPHNSLLVSVNVNNSGKPVLTSQGVLVGQPDDISNCHIPVSGVPFGPDKQVWSG